jgi:hypothetical protein
MSEVSIEESSLLAEAELIAQEHAPPLASGGEELLAPVGPTPEQMREGYKTLSFAIVDRTAGVLCPAWNVTAEEKGSLAGAIADALLLWFPDQLIPPKYMALLVVAGVSLEIVDKRRDPITGELKPRVHAPKKPTVAAAPPPAAPA